MFRVYAAAVLCKISRLTAPFHILFKADPHVVNRNLCVLHNVHIAKPRRAVLFGKEYVKFVRVSPVCIKSILHPFLRLCGIKQIPFAEFDKMQRHSSALVLFVIPVHHHALVRRVNRVIVHVFCTPCIAAASEFEIRVFPLHLLPVHQLNVKQVRAFLNILYPRLPEQIENIHVHNADVPHTIVLILVPENLVNPCAAFQLVMPCVVVCLLKVVLLQNHRHNLGKHLRIRLVPLLSRQKIRLWVVIHCVRVLVR